MGDVIDFRKKEDDDDEATYILCQCEEEGSLLIPQISGDGGLPKIVALVCVSCGELYEVIDGVFVDGVE